MGRGSYLIHILRICLVLFVAAGLQSPLELIAGSASDSSAPPVIIFGFVGGFVRHDDTVHDEVRFAARLRKEYPVGVDVETFENRNGENAFQKIMNLLGMGRDRKLSMKEIHNARIILFGHSWGAAEAVNLARRLDKAGIPVLLTIQVDSVSKLGQNDEVIPANVRQAVNFYQTDGLVHGAPEIRAADPARTRIIGNFRFNYADVPYSCADYPLYLRLFMKAHTQIECDSRVWQQAEALIRSVLQSAMENEVDHAGAK
jgi:hypothetical protein